MHDRPSAASTMVVAFLFRLNSGSCGGEQADMVEKRMLCCMMPSKTKESRFFPQALCTERLLSGQLIFVLLWTVSGHSSLGMLTEATLSRRQPDLVTFVNTFFLSCYYEKFAMSYLL